MKELTNQARKEFDLLESNYLVTREQVKREHADYKKQRNIMFGVLAIVMLLSCFNTYFALETSREAKRIQTVVYQDDGSGGITVMRSLQASANLKIDKEKLTSYTRNQLSEYLRALYSVPNSKEMRQENVYKVLYMTQKLYYDQVPRQVFKGSFNPDAKGVTTIEIRTASLVNSNVWQLNWTKKLNGDEIGKFKTWVTFKQEDIENLVIANYNPLGIVVTNIDTQADL